MVVANVDARPHGDPEEWPQLLSAQLCSPVRWRQSLDTLFGEGMQTFVELGPGGVLTGLLRRAAPTTDTVGLSVSTPDELARLVRILAGNTSGTAPTGELFEMTERLIVSPAVGLFEPAAGLNGYLPGSGAPGGESVFIEVGELLGLVGGTEVRSAFSGSLEGVLVLAGERVTRGQPVAWLRARASADRAVQGDRAGQTDSSPPESQPVKDWAVDDGAGREARSFQDERTA